MCPTPNAAPSLTLEIFLYFGKLWDLLIPGAKKTAVLEQKGAITAEVMAALTAGNNNVKDPKNIGIDLNHIWVGIDVANNPQKWYSLVKLFSGLNGAAVATALDGRHLVAFNRDHGGERGEELVCLQFDAEGQLVAEVNPILQVVEDVLLH